MDQQIKLSADEKLAIERVCSYYQPRTKFAFTITLDYYLGRLSRIIANVEKGYPLSIDDYTNDLCVRDIFQEILDVCPNNADLLEWINSWDERFDKATKLVNNALLPTLDGSEPGWWWFRLPINQGNQLKEWLNNYWKE
jgi:hypothetical protein